MKRRWMSVIGAGLAALLVSVTVLSSTLEARSTVNQPFAIDGVTRTLAHGEVDWYVFPYAGDGSQVEVWLDHGTGFGINFGVWTSENAKNIPAGETPYFSSVEPVGRGTFNEFGPGVLSWSGNFIIPGFYFVAVENTGLDPASYVLRISGTGLTLP